MYKGHSQPTTVAKFSPNGFWVASADVSGMVRVWAWDNPEHLTKLETFPFAGEVKDLDWDGESKKILAVGEGNPLVSCNSIVSIVYSTLLTSFVLLLCLNGSLPRCSHGTLAIALAS